MYYIYLYLVFLIVSISTEKKLYIRIEEAYFFFTKKEAKTNKQTSKHIKGKLKYLSEKKQI